MATAQYPGPAAAENPPPKLEILGAEQPLGRRAILALGGLAATGVLAGLPVITALHSVESSTAHVDIAPGISAEVSGRPGPMSTLDLLGAIGSVGNDKWHGTIPVIGASMGASVRVNPVEIEGSTRGIANLYGALAVDPQRTITRPLERALIKKAATGAATGLALDGLLIVPAFAGWRMRKRHNAGLSRLHTDLSALETELSADHSNARMTAAADGLRATVRSMSKEPLPKWRRRCYASTVGLALLTGAGGEIAVLHSQLMPVSNECFQPIDETVLADASRALQGSEVCGVAAAMAINSGWPEVQSRKDSIDVFWQQRIRTNIIKAVGPWRQNPVNARILNDPDNAVFLDISDVHCSFPYMQDALPVMVSEVQPDAIINTGDTMVTAGTKPFEPLCITALDGALTAPNVRPKNGVTRMIAILGNHDAENTTGKQMEQLEVRGNDAKRYHPITVLEGPAGAATLDGIHFVGGTDPRISDGGNDIALRTRPDRPLSPDGEREALAGAGTAIAKAACASLGKWSVAPVVLVHAREEGYEAMQQGCASTELSGHYHMPNGPYTHHTPAGATTFMYTQGTSSGINSDALTLYDTVSRVAPTSVLVFDKLTNRVVAFSTITLHPDGTVTIPPLQTQAAKELPDSTVSDFLATYDGASQLASRPAATPRPAAARP